MLNDMQTQILVKATMGVHKGNLCLLSTLCHYYVWKVYIHSRLTDRS